MGVFNLNLLVPEVAYSGEPSHSRSILEALGFPSTIGEANARVKDLPALGVTAPLDLSSDIFGFSSGYKMAPGFLTGPAG